ncbi:hypothetical protein [Listeria booriae]|uniref:Uncharacterized protein n=1 Tax=Listeria booriae TaxID=1552123 RepID=A0A7X0XU28_9LIST|nr:hypothetical protein [Listeria booriae]MBC1228596.1 hypothetical protein [Listeria booriae]MBC1780579.1 hypothetical protein [Listeria booriae]
MNGVIGGGSNPMNSLLDFNLLDKSEESKEMEDLPQLFQYILKEDADTFFLYPKLLLLFKEVIREEQLYPFFDTLSIEEQQFIRTIYGPNRVFSNERVCEERRISPEQRRKQVRIIRYRLQKFLSKER